MDPMDQDISTRIYNDPECRENISTPESSGGGKKTKKTLFFLLTAPDCCFYGNIRGPP